ncbi:hypothetical protein AAC387_Pa07g2821 [Persea americana]
MAEISVSSSSLYLSGNQSPQSDGSQLPAPVTILRSTTHPKSDIPESSNARYDGSSGGEREHGVFFMQAPAKIRSCDVYIGLHGRKPAVVRFVNWLRAELELQGVSCIVTDRARCRDADQHRMAELAMGAATIGAVVISKKSFSNPYSIEEMRYFLGKKNLVPIFFGLDSKDCLVRDVIERRGEMWERDGGELWVSYGGVESEWKEAVDGLSHVSGQLKIEANPWNWRDCITEAVFLLGMRLGRRFVTERVRRWKERVEKDELPFPRNTHFIGRKRELFELELMLFGDVEEGGDENQTFELKTSSSSSGRRRRRKGKGKMEIEEKKRKKEMEELRWKESREDIEMEGGEGLSLPKGKKKGSSMYGKGIACVSGNSGLGKTELLLEFAYKFSQRYRLVLWIDGETRYLSQNYMNLLSLLDVDLTAENELCPERDKPRTFMEMEHEALRRVRKEMMRDIPFLIVIDNLEDERDWWDGKNVMEFLPRFGGETHIIISTRLPRILNMENLKLSHLSSAEALSLMKGRMEDPPVEEVLVLSAMEERLGRITLGLALVGVILSELSITPTKLLDSINSTPLRNIKWSGKEDPVLRRNPFFLQLLDFCFSVFDPLATRMVLASGWFAPSRIWIPLLALAASEIDEDETHHRTRLWNKCLPLFTRCWFKPNETRSEEEASSMLVRFKFARETTKRGFIHIHEIFRLYARKRGGVEAAEAMVRAVASRGSIPRDSMHIWAACFLLFKFGTDPSIVELKVTELVSFIKQLALPLAVLTYTAFFRFNAAKELLHLSTEALEAAEEKIETGLERSFCWGDLNHPKTQLNLKMYQELALLNAKLLETRVELMMRGGVFDVAERLCRTAISIRQVICGWDHPLTLSVRERMDRITRIQANMVGI